MSNSNSLSLQVHVVTMNRDDHLFLQKMNIQSDALIGNQCDCNKVENFDFSGHRMIMYSWNERGVGLNRNNLLLRSEADIVLFADDDVVYEDGYADIVLKAFEEHPEADMITFNVIPLPRSIDPKLNTKWKRIHKYNCLKYGAPRMAVRLSRLREKNVYFSLLFGGGAKYSSGEDSLFIMDCIKRGLKVYAYPADIGTVTFETSSWFTGFHDKYFKDKGIFFYHLSSKLSKLLCLQYCVRHQKLFQSFCSWKQAYRLMISGIKEYRMEVHGK